ncbi:S9 family peptidase [Arthrobacter sp. Sa2BUA2]|uniref:S9 family peptidase n=1 Tax=Arthrobacter pullicola TaxID=2762224 RepID=A0ABR8YHG7_9MICC|nr:S9 family peptidase [Arthrobacter pullicola]MBD8043663.1 S9 family peptidase [Arthrobacter pullicola]
MKPSDLDLLNSVSEPAIHPDGSRAVVSVQRPDFSADAYVGQLWNVSLAGGEPQRISRGFNDAAPRFSPDGTVLAFLRSDPGGRPQLFAMPAGGGEPLQLTDRRLGVSWFRFSPDSARIVFSSRDPEHGRYGTVDGVPPGSEDPRLITTFNYRMNGAGYSRDKRVQAFVLTLPDLTDEPFIKPAGRAAAADGAPGTSGRTGLPEVLQLTDCDADALNPVFTADGTHVLFSAALHAEADTDLVTDVYAIPAGGGAGPRRLSNLGTGTRLSVSDPVQSLDGKWLFYLGQDLAETGRDFVARNTALYAAPVLDPASPVRLTDPSTVDLAGGGIVPDGADAALVLNLSRGSSELLRVNARGAVSTLVSGPRVVTGAAAADSGTVVVTFTDPSTAGDVAALDPAAPGNLRKLTDFSAALRSRTTVRPPQEETHLSADGYPVHGWVVLPEGEGPHPVLLNIHGGPFSQYGWGLFDEAQVYAAAGYAVVMCNPRGSSGYGQEHGRAIKEAMGTLDLQDVLGFLEGVLASHPELNAGRLGVMGGSYGGYLTAWTIAQDHRFTAAIVERGFLDPLSFIGSSDIGWFFSEAYTGADPERVLAQSPFAQVDKVKTPALVIHSEEDLRCPVEQAQRYYTALKLRNVPTGLLLFPGENHELSRTGTPWHRRQRFEHILAWWARWLPTAANSTEESTADDGEPATAGV